MLKSSQDKLIIGVYIMEQLEQRITSMELCELINKLRVEEKGEEAKVLDHYNLMKKIKKELETMKTLGLNNDVNIYVVKYKDKKGESRPCYSLNASGMRQILNSESTYVRVKTEEYIKKLEEENNKLKEVVQKPQLSKEDELLISIAKATTKETQMIAVGEYGRYKEEQVREREVKPLQEENKILAPKADYTDRVLQAEGLITTTLIAKDFGLSARKLNDILNKEGVQYKQGRTWVLYSKYQDKGYSQTTTDKEGHVSMKWTQAGKKFIVELLQSLGYTLNIEK